MNEKEYLENALKTESNDFGKISERFSLRSNQRLIHAIAGIGSELVEMRQAIEKLDRVNFLEECSDAYWYLAIAEDVLGFSILDFSNRKQPNESVGIILLSIEKNVGKLLDAVIKKGIFYDKDRSNCTYSCFRGVSEAVNKLVVKMGSTPSEVAKINIKKLKARFGDKFSEERANNRDLPIERQILEDVLKKD